MKYMSHRSKSKSRQRKPGIKKPVLNLPGDYPWLVLRSLIKDLEYLLPDSSKKALSVLIRHKDMTGLRALSEEWGLQSTTTIDNVKELAELRARYQVSALLKKFQFPADDKAQEQAAIKKFIAAEDLCREVNHVGFPRNVRNEELDLASWSFARDFIRRVLGDSLPDDQILNWRARHGPGSTLTTVKGKTSAYYKYSELPYTCTGDCLDAAKALILSDDRWFNALLTDYCLNRQISCAVSYVKGRISYSFFGETVFDWEEFWTSIIEVVEGNRIAFVPKNALTKRSIAIEPTLNLMLQLGVDGFIRKRLKRFGVNLDDQSRNQELARQGSIDDSSESFCTIDLASASDTISISICRWLLPECWFDYLMKIRSPKGLLGNETISYEKISSMGNGCTFAIESLIFSSLIYAVRKLKVGPGFVDNEGFACFGDDLIVRKKHVSALYSILRKSGFRINTEKSFVDGPVRESCGADWCQGKPIRPVYLTSLPKNVRELWSDVNRLQRILSLRFGVELGRDSAIKALFAKWIPQNFRKFSGPASDEDMDSYLHEPRTEFNSVYDRGFFAYKFRRCIEHFQPTRLDPATSWIYRKLMHDLRPFRIEQFYDSKVVGNGSRFEVYDRNKTYLSCKLTPVKFWREDYRELAC